MRNVLVDALHRHARRIVAVLVVVSLYGMARLPSLDGAERTRMAERFRFTAFSLAEMPGESRSVRPVHPSLRHIEAWISSVGAAVALTDADGDGLSNDLCHVDPRTDRVIVSPVPGTGARYAPFVLDPAPLPYAPATMAPMGCLPGDMTEDGAPDLLVYYWGRTPVAFLRRRGSPMTAGGYARAEVVEGVERWFTNAATFADVDGDGHADLVVGNYFPDGARILDAAADGGERMQHSMSRAYNGGRNRVLLWDGPARFREVAGVFSNEVAHAWTLAAGAADLDGDGLPELYFANDFGPDRLLHNRSQPGAPRLALLEGRQTPGTPRSKVLGRDSFKGMGVDIADLDGDGRLDIYVSNIAGEYALEESHFAWIATGRTEEMRRGVAPFVDRSEPLGLSRSSWGWESRLGDFDNDGMPEAVQAIGFVRGRTNRWPELHETAMGNDQLLSTPAAWHRFEAGDVDLSGQDHPRFFVRNRAGRYHDLAADVGLGTPQVTRGIATADVDGDGDLDMALANQWDVSRFYRNDAPRPGTFLGLRLLLPVENSPPATVVRAGHPAVLRAYPAIGAAAKVRLPDGSVRVGQVDGGSGHSGKRAPELHWGLGDLPADATLRVELRWRGVDGHMRTETLELGPGWHTIVLGASVAGGSDV